jgi:hypothetical protein
MAKSSGLGAALWVGGYDISGDVGSVDKISAKQATIEVTGINKFAIERVYALRDGSIDFTSFFNPSNNGSIPGAKGEHFILSQLPTADTQVICCPSATAIGQPAAALQAKQINYDPKRSAKGELTFQTMADGEGFGMEWGVLATPGVRTDTTATNGTTLDNAASTAFGLQAYLQVMSVTGTSVTVTVAHSTDNVTFTSLVAFAAATPGASPQAQRVSVSNATTVNRYLRIQTTGTFSNAVFGVVVVRNVIAGTVF